MLRLSYIVPVYRVEPYLRTCVDSLLNQGLRADEYEIILVDDGSPDRCGEICDEYAASFPNVHVIHQENRGLSGARNTGIREARGKYCQFVDSDDFLVPQKQQILLDQIEKDDLDVLRFNYETVNETGAVYHPWKNPKQYSDYSTTVCTGEDFLTERLGYACYACQFLLRTELIRGCLFVEGIRFEDTEWVGRLMPMAHRVSSTAEIVYQYRLRRESITTTNQPELIHRNIEDKIKVIRFLKESRETCARKEWFNGMISILAISLLSTVAKSLYKERKNYIRLLREEQVFPLSTYHLTRQATRKAYLINLSPELFCRIYHR